MSDILKEIGMLVKMAQAAAAHIAPATTQSSPAAAPAASNGDDVADRFNRGVEMAIPFAEKWEGFAPKAHWDVNGYAVGHGHHTIMDPITKKTRPVVKGDTITEDESSKLMQKRFREYAYKLYKNHAWSKGLDSETIAAALDKMHNAGVNIFDAKRSPNLNKRMSAAGANPNEVFWSEFPTYTRSEGKAISALVNRMMSAVGKWGPESLKKKLGIM